MRSNLMDHILSQFIMNDQHVNAPRQANRVRG
jgi:hypothetical protein